MRLLVCGGRDYAGLATAFAVLDIINKSRPVSTVIEGGARGADRLGRQWADALRIPVVTYAADWDKHGKAAGHIRNALMPSHGKPDFVVAFPGGAGTANMVRIAQEAGVPVWRHWKEPA